MGQADIETDGDAAGLGGTLVRRLHDSGTAACDDAVARPGQISCNLLGKQIIPVIR